MHRSKAPANLDHNIDGGRLTDNGGAGTLSQLVIVKEYMARLAHDLGVNPGDLYPADYFELIGGVGFGGPVALMLGHLRMNVEEASDALVSIASAVFLGKSQEQPDSETNLKNLRDAVESMLQARQIPIDMKMNDKRNPPAKCTVVIYAATSANLNRPVAFRTCPTRGSSLNPTITEAICATIANPSFFSPVKIGKPLREQIFVGGGLGANNPTREVLKEANTLFGKDRRVAQIISIGSGRWGVLTLGHSATLDSIGRLAEEIASDCETVAHELSTKLFGIAAYLRLNVDRGMENLGMSSWDVLGAIESHTSAYVETNAVSEALETSLKRLQGKIGQATLEQINHSSNVKTMVRPVPPVSPYHVLRQKEWQCMLYWLFESETRGQRIFAITGMGGCGKTQMVSHFLRERGACFNHIVFVDASSSASIRTDVQAWAQGLGDGHEDDLWEDGLKFLAFGPHNGQWAYILDSADDPELELTHFLPRNHSGTVIITSRNRDVGNLANTYHLELGQMEPQEALSTLIQATRRELPIPSAELQAAHSLVQELGFLALALVHAGTYCWQLSSRSDGILEPFSFTRYLSLFHSQRSVLMKRDGPTTLDGYRRGVYTTLDLSYRAIPQPSRDFLHFVSHFQSSGIPLSIVAAAADHHFKDPDTLLPRPGEHSRTITHLSSLFCLEGTWSEIQVQHLIQSLQSFSLVSSAVVADSLFIQLHPLVQAWARDMVVSSTQNDSNMVRQTLTSSCLTGCLHLYRHLIPHIDHMLLGNQGPSLHVNDQVAFGRVLKQQGHCYKAGVLFNEALETMRDVAGEETKETLVVAGWLAESLWYGGRWDEAEMMELEVLKQRTRLLGPDDPDTITAAANLASTYHTQGRWNEAEKLMLDVLEQRRKLTGKEHPDTIAAAANLVCTYGAQGRWNEAEILGSYVLEQRRRTLGSQHPDTLSAIGNLATTYHVQGRWKEAETLDIEVLEQRRRILGPEDPETIQAAANLACTYGEQGRHGEAERLEVQVLEQRRRILGTEHPDALRAAANFAVTQTNLDKWREAEQLLIPVVQGSIQVLGVHHPQAQVYIRHMASVFNRLGKSEEAEEVERLLL